MGHMWAHWQSGTGSSQDPTAVTTLEVMGHMWAHWQSGTGSSQDPNAVTTLEVMGHMWAHWQTGTGSSQDPTAVTTLEVMGHMWEEGLRRIQQLSSHYNTCTYSDLVCICNMLRLYIIT